MPPPRALRVATLPDRLILHDTTPYLRSRDPSARNALIDAANAATRAASQAPTPSLIDLEPVHTPPRVQSPSSDSRPTDRYLVIPFADGAAPFETSDAAAAGLRGDAGPGMVSAVDAAAGFLGVLRLHSAEYAVVVREIRRGGQLPNGGAVMVVHRVKFFKIGSGGMTRLDREFSGAVTKLLESGALYFGVGADITRSCEKGGGSGSSRDEKSDRVVGNAFWWTWPMARLGGRASATWALRTVYGFVGTELMRFSLGAGKAAQLDRHRGPGGGAADAALPDPVAGGKQFTLTLISRRSRRRAGTRYITRGVDALGDVANFVETEQIVWSDEDPGVFTSFSVIRGSIPVFWRQVNGIARPSPELDASLAASRAAFSAHFKNIVRSYGGVVAVSLVDMEGTEGVLADAFERHFELDVSGAFDGSVLPKLVSFDFHRHCGGKEYERGLEMLLSKVKDDVRRFGFFSEGVEAAGVPKAQKGVFRVNCVDCLDRTNVVQSLLARVALDMQLQAVFHGDLRHAAAPPRKEAPELGPRLYSDAEDRFKHVWGDNADAVSKQYSGTGALKTDFTRTGKRSTTGMVGDGVKSVVRMYYKNFVDEGRQEAIDILCGSANVRPIMHSDEENGGNRHSAGPSPGRGGTQASGSSARSDPSLWYSFEALRMNGGGDRQAVSVELRDEFMQLSTPEGVNVEYPRRGLIAWDKCEDTKSGDRKNPSRLRLIHHPSTGSPASASPLDLLFRAGPAAREKFLRAYLSWSQPAVRDEMEAAVRVRVLSARGVSKHCMADWGLSGDISAESRGRKPGSREVVALIVPEGHSDTRQWGLAAVPVDVDDSDYVLVSARAVSSRGPAIAVLASKQAASSIMAVSEAMIGRAGSLTGGGAVGISLVVSGTSVCFVSARLGGAKDLFRILSSLRLRRIMFDVTNQFEHFYIAGVMGDLQWRNGDVPDDGPDARKFLTLGDGAKAYSLGNGLSVMRNSFPLLEVKDSLTNESFWRQRKSGEGSSSAHEENPKSFGAEGAAAPYPGTIAHEKHHAGAEAGFATSTGGGKKHLAGEGPSLVVEMADDLVQGRPAPTLPSTLSRCIITISDLRGEGIKMPPGIDQATPLNTFFAVYSDYVGADPVVTRPTMRPTDRPDWRESIRLSLVPSEASDVKRGFLLGQVLIPMPLAEPIPAGHCVIPIGYAEKGKAEFEVPLRLAGIATGRLYGYIELEVLEGLEDFSSQTDLDLSAGEEQSSSASPSPSYGQTRGVLDGPGIPSFGMSPSLAAKPPSIEDMNEKFDMARKKGSKQIKSMVGKLSSFLNQAPGQGSQLNTLHGPRSGGGGHPPLSLPEASSEGRASGPNGNRSTAVPRRSLSGTESTASSEFGAFESAVSLSPPAPSDSRMRRDVVGPSDSNPRWQLPPMLPNAPSPHASRANSRRAGRPDPLLDGLSSRPAGGTTAASRSPRASSRPEHVSLGSGSGSNDDALLRSLSKSRSRPVDKAAVVGEDDLLAGLKAASLDQAPNSGRSTGGTVPDTGVAPSEEDDWGAFEAVDPASPQAMRSARNHTKSSSREESAKSEANEANLIDL